MKILVLGGTVFLGRHLVETALVRGHEVTLFNRGQTNAHLFPQLEKLRGDRDGNLESLRWRRWDAAIDTSGYLPRIVRMSAHLLADAVDHYTFVSSLSVYADFQEQGIDESHPVGTLEDESVETISGETYGPLKALCEKAVREAMPGRTLTLRPGLIVGPHDPTDRFTYWVRRVAQGSEVLAPAPATRRVQFIDVRDLARWTLRRIEAGDSHVYNVTGPVETLTFKALLEGCQQVSGSDARFTWIEPSFLLQAGVQPWTEVPLWVPEEQAGMLAVDCSRAIDAGLTYRPLSDTLRDTLEWDRSRPEGQRAQAGLTREREAELLQDWHARL